MAQPTVKFACVGRMVDRVVIATYLHDDRDNNLNEYVRSVQEVLKVSRQQVQPMSRHKLSFDLGTLHFLADRAGCLFALLTSPAYPERHAFACVEELITKFNAANDQQINMAAEGMLTRPNKKLFRDVCSKYDDPRKVDKAAAVMDKVESVKDIMQDNVKKILKTHENLEVLEDKTDNLRISANQFQRSAVDLKRMMYMRNLKLKLVLALVILSVLAYVIVPIAVKFWPKSESSK